MEEKPLETSTRRLVAQYISQYLCLLNKIKRRKSHYSPIQKSVYGISTLTLSGLLFENGKGHFLP